MSNPVEYNVENAQNDLLALHTKLAYIKNHLIQSSNLRLVHDCYLEMERIMKTVITPLYNHRNALAMKIVGKNEEAEKDGVYIHNEKGSRRYLSENKLNYYIKDESLREEFYEKKLVSLKKAEELCKTLAISVHDLVEKIPNKDATLKVMYTYEAKRK